MASFKKCMALGVTAFGAVAAPLHPASAAEPGDEVEAVANGRDQLLDTQTRCEDLTPGDPVCTTARIYAVGSGGVAFTVTGTSYPSGSTIWAQANVYYLSYKDLRWRDMTDCHGATSCTYSNSLDCGPGEYILDGWSWRSGSSVQPMASARAWAS
jgi:hypothetical protein